MGPENDKKKKFCNFNETIPKSPVKKMSGILNFNLMNENIANSPEDKKLKLTRDYIVAGIKMNIEDVYALKMMDSPNKSQ